MEEFYASILKVILFLLGITGLMVIFKKYGFKFPLNQQRKEENSGLRKIDTLHLGYRKFISVLEVKDRVLIIGVSDREICLLDKWRKDEKE
jgi:flagellar biogenesis protein FliO